MLTLALNCEQYQALPYSGGVMEQPAGLLKKIKQVGNVYKAYTRYDVEGKKPGGVAKWKRENEAIWNIIEWVEELRERHG